MPDEVSQAQIKETPKICAIDLEEEVVDSLRSSGLQCFSGTLGTPVSISRSTIYQERQCYPNHHLPSNLHEYDIVVVDLRCKSSIKYQTSRHAASSVKGRKKSVFISSHPETVFDPRPYVASLLGAELGDLYRKDSLIIVFSDSNEVVNYQVASISPDDHEGERSYFQKSLYGFLPSLGWVYNKVGQKVCTASSIAVELTNLLQKYIQSFQYKVVFNHPKVQENNQTLERKDFVPLLLNADNEITAFVDFSLAPSATLVFPQLICNKREFIVELINDVLPGIFPKLFPYSEQFSWLKSDDYSLPNQITLLEKKRKLEEDYTKALVEIDKQIESNQNLHQFLHDLLTESDAKLVKAAEHFFNWLGFSNVLNLDETSPEIKEEDLQIPFEDGLLVVEVKGIGGTSRDSACSQISKIKFRRSEDRKRFDVFALYLVNHQRYLPPLARRNPPFTEHQINDAQFDKRGLLTTYELFKLYFAIEEGFITREDARNALLQYGLVNFSPSNASLIGSPLEIHYEGTVVIIEIEKTSLSKGMKIIVCDDGAYFKAEILEIKIDNKSVENASSGEIGIRFDCKIPKSSKLWFSKD